MASRSRRARGSRRITEEEAFSSQRRVRNPRRCEWQQIPCGVRVSPVTGSRQLPCRYRTFYEELGRRGPRIRGCVFLPPRARRRSLVGHTMFCFRCLPGFAQHAGMSCFFFFHDCGAGVLGFVNLTGPTHPAYPLLIALTPVSWSIGLLEETRSRQTQASSRCVFPRWAGDTGPDRSQPLAAGRRTAGSGPVGPSREGR